MIKKLREEGLTITELVIYVAVAGIVSLLIFSLGFDLYVSNLKSSVRAEMSINASNIFNILSTEIRLASDIKNANTLTDDNQPGGGWQTSNTNGTLVISTPTLDSDGNFIMETAAEQPYFNELVYFIEDGNLYKRTLANEDATGNGDLTSCPESESSPTCPPDKIFTTDSISMTFTFYDQDNAVITGNDFTGARSVEISVQIERPVYGELIEYDATTRATMRNIQ